MSRGKCRSSRFRRSTFRTLRSGGKVVAYGMTSMLRSGRLAGKRGAGRIRTPGPTSLIHCREYLSISVTRCKAPGQRRGLYVAILEH
jgi:hypothetical protein